MTYNSVSDLPPQVRLALLDEDLEPWLSVYNETESAVKAWDSISNVRRLEFFASAEVVDNQGDKVKADAVLEAMPDYIAAGGPLYNEHTSQMIGTVYAYDADSAHGYPAVKCRAAVFRGTEFYDKIWSEISSGQKSAVSIGFHIGDTKRICSSTECHNEIDTLQLYDISACVSPANPESWITSANFKAKSNGPDISGPKEDEQMTEEESAQAPPEEKEEVQKGGEEDAMAQLFARLDALEARLNAKEDKPEAEVPPAEEAPVKSEDEACKCKNKSSKTDEILEARKAVETAEKSMGPKTPLPGMAEGVEDSIDLPKGRLMSTAEIEKMILRGN